MTNPRMVFLGLIVSTILALVFLTLYFTNVLPSLPKTIIYFYLFITVITGFVFGTAGFREGSKVYWAAVVLILDILILGFILLGLLITSM